MEKSFSEQGLKVFFVLKDNQEPEETSEFFQKAFKKCTENNIRPQWITESKCKTLELVKTVVLVFQKFEGPTFKTATQKTCVILGPACILYFLMKGIASPDGPYPVYTYAMKDISICVTGFGTLHKEDLRKKVLYMGGKFFYDLTAEVTHLVVAESLGATSQKYSIAAEKKLPIMQERWIHETWELSQKQLVHAEEPPLNALKCPPFSNLKISCTRVSKARKDNMKQIIESKGGKYMPELVANETDVLIVGCGAGDKFKAALKWKIPCVSEDWFKESVKSGYSLKFIDFEVKSSVKCSTPESERTFLDPNLSAISCTSSATITGRRAIEDTMMGDTFLEPNPPRPSTSTQIPTKSNLALNSVNQTGQALNQSSMSQTACESAHKTPEKSNRTMNLQLNTGESALEKIEHIKVKEVQSGFLDNYQIYLSGFPENIVDKVRKIINRGGGTRLNQISDDVTHVLVATANISPDEEKTLKKCDYPPLVVRADWLVACVEQGCAVKVDCFIASREVEKQLEPSPLSKRGLQLLQKSENKTRNSTVVTPLDLELTEQYLPVHNSPENVTQMDTMPSPAKAVPEVLATPLPDDQEAPQQNEPTLEESTTIEGEEESTFFKDLKFFAAGLSKEETERMKDLVVRSGGLWQKKSAAADYVIVPVLGTKSKYQDKEKVTPYWIEECYESASIVPIEYYHLPVEITKHNKPLTGCVLAVSNYIGKERTFLSVLGTQLGALFQEVFAKKKAPERNAEASTHLLCPTPAGDKYKAAVKWKLPVVTKDWLLVCAQDGTHTNEEPFLLEGSSMSPKTTVAAVNTPKQKDVEGVSTPNSVIGDSRVSLTSNEPPKKPVPEQPAIASPISAVPTRLLRSSKTPQQPKQPSVAVDDCTTPESNKKSENITEYVTPKTLLPHSQPYTPFTPPALKKPPSPVKDDKKAPVGKVDLSALTPNTYMKYWESKMPGYIATPETPYGAAFKADPSPQTRKNWKKCINSIPDEAIGPNDLKFVKVKAPPQAMQRKRTIEDHGGSPVLAGGHTKKSKQGENSLDKKDEESTSTSEKMQKMQTSRFFDDSTDQEMEENEHIPDDSNILIPKPQKGKYKFMLTGIDDEARCQLESLITSLGGIVAEVTSFDPTATHIINTVPARSEKLLASIASGKWVLHFTYLFDSNEKKGFLDEEEYEWGNPKATTLKELKDGSVQKQLADACYRWRSLLHNTPGKGAYSDMKAIVQGRNPNKRQAFIRLIEAGGGEVMDVSTPFTKENLKGVTHCFIDDNFDADDIATLEKQNVPYLNAIYLNDFLMETTPPTPQQWRESKRILNKSKVN